MNTSSPSPMSTLSMTASESSSWVIVISAISSSLFLWYLIATSIPSLKPALQRPPLVKGFIPWLGCALSFSQNPIAFTQRLTRRLGPVVTMFTAGRKITLICHRDLIHSMLRNTSKALIADTVHFELLSKAFNIHTHDRVGTRDLIYKHLYPHVDRYLSKGNFETSGAETSAILAKELFKLQASLSETRPLYLGQIIEDVLFPAATLSLYGSAYPAHESVHDFHIFDEGVPLLVSGIPLISRTPAKARERLVAHMCTWIRKLDTPEDAGISEVMGGCIRLIRAHQMTEDTTARLLLAFLFAANTNSLRNTFWCLSHLLQDAEALRRVKKEVDALVDGRFKGDISAMTPSALEEAGGMPVLESAIFETLRMYSTPVSARRAEEDFVLSSRNAPSFTIRKGEDLLANNYSIHYNEGYFQDPHRFQLDRFLSSEGESDEGETKLSQGALLVFGGGHNICKGRFVAIYQLKIFITSFLYTFDVEPVGVGLPGRKLSSEMRIPSRDFTGIGTARPTEDIQIHLRPCQKVSSS
ncbi:cytochrome P450 [Sistotremastrum niveocremeum HHB9708]|uniref:Cytochrome P450 n=1 Tax=Sistotremastrum niveocremeum HHB9708 TaxID=1314777 RepID=A0A164Q2K3_9AGAM|nr:cytochrome P450 [Sistotremastrum niveocremeum HHB9708]